MRFKPGSSHTTVRHATTRTLQPAMRPLALVRDLDHYHCDREGGRQSQPRHYSITPFTRYSRLSNQLSNCVERNNRFDNRVEQTAVHSTGCQTALYNRFDNQLYTRYSRFSNRLSNGFDNRLNICIHDTTGCQTDLTIGLTTSCIVYTNI